MVLVMGWHADCDRVEPSMKDETAMQATQRTNAAKGWLGSRCPPGVPFAGGVAPDGSEPDEPDPGDSCSVRGDGMRRDRLEGPGRMVIFPKRPNCSGSTGPRFIAFFRSRTQFPVE